MNLPIIIEFSTLDNPNILNWKRISMLNTDRINYNYNYVSILTVQEYSSRRKYTHIHLSLLWNI